MSAKNRLRKLPHLLSSLPQNGKHALIRPTTYPPDSFYFVTRSRLRFSPIPSPSASNAPSSEKEKGKEREVIVDPVEAPGLRAHGRACGMLFWKG